MINERIFPDAESGGAEQARCFSGDAVDQAQTPLQKVLADCRAAVIARPCGRAATWWALDERSTVRYVTAPVAKGAVTRTVTATGTVNPELTIIVGATVSGVIQELFCDYNTQVKKGQVCAKIDPRPYQSVVD